MDEAAVSRLLSDAKYTFDQCAFSPLHQAEFFKAMTDAVHPTPPPTSAPIHAHGVAEESDGVSASGTVTDARKKK